MSRARLMFRWNELFNLSVDPNTGKIFHDEILLAEGAKLSVFYFMKITDDVRAFAAKEGVAEQAALEKIMQFVMTGAEIYRQE